MCPDCGAAARDGSCDRCGWRTAARANLDTMRRIVRGVRSVDDAHGELARINLVNAGLSERARR